MVPTSGRENNWTSKSNAKKWFWSRKFEKITDATSSQNFNCFSFCISWAVHFFAKGRKCVQSSQSFRRSFFHFIRCDCFWKDFHHHPPPTPVFAFALPALFLPVPSGRSSWRRLCTTRTRWRRSCSRARGRRTRRRSCPPCFCERVRGRPTRGWASRAGSRRPSGRTGCGRSASSRPPPWCRRPCCAAGTDPLGPPGEFLQTKRKRNYSRFKTKISLPHCKKSDLLNCPNYEVNIIPRRMNVILVVDNTR